VHKADYLRVYFLYHYGAAYSDIKRMKESWRQYWVEFKDSDVWLVGLPEIKGGVAHRPGSTYPPSYYEYVISNGFMIARPRSEYLKNVHVLHQKDLDMHLSVLKQHPAPDSGRCGQSDPHGYPIRWAISCIGLPLTTIKI
jgi:hypothetical protein